MVRFETLREAEVAMAAVEAFRQSGSPDHAASDVPAQPYGAKGPLIDKLVKGLDIAPLTRIKARVLRTLLDASPGSWIPYAAFGDAVADLCIPGQTPRNRAGAAIRDLSFQLKQVLPSSVLSDVNVPIELLTDRIRTGGEFSYRLTEEGRIAVERFLEMRDGNAEPR